MRKKIALIGGGNIGGVLAELIAYRELGDVMLSTSSRDCRRARRSITRAHARGGVMRGDGHEPLRGHRGLDSDHGGPRASPVCRATTAREEPEIMKSVALGVKQTRRTRT